MAMQTTDSDSTPLKASKPIRRLDESVVNRIAAGEIIHRPANALKELIENSLDAGSTSIQVLIKDGGLKLLQIQDNGHGIQKDDLPIVCERFTTSKLRKFDDLSSISTYGFRGEALASISHIAHVTITTKTTDSNCAWRASYSDGKLVPQRPGEKADPKATAGNNGTQITAEDLFYNVPTRRKAFKNLSDEYNRILDVVQRYAIHNAGVSFSCKKQGSNIADVHTSSSATTLDCIRQIYGNSVASELLEFSQEFKNLEFMARGWISSANYHVKKMVFLLFINHRSVESSNLKKTIENIYSFLLPKNSHPFVYLSLEIEPRNVDVNVHPTKQEVHFLDEEAIIAAVGDKIQECLANANSSRTFLTQTLLPGVPILQKDTKDNGKDDQRSSRIQDKRLVRTDSRMRTLDTFLTTGDTSPSQDSPIAPKRPRIAQFDEGEPEDVEMLDANDAKVNDEIPLTSPPLRKAPARTRVEMRLTSVLNLRKTISQNEHTGLTQLFANHTFVGCIDGYLALVQHQTKLYLINYSVISEELFYQLVLKEFGNFGIFNLSVPISIRDYVLFALEEEQSHMSAEQIGSLRPKEEIAQIIADMLGTKRELLQEYFSIKVSEDGLLESLPIVLKGWIPNIERLPMFLLRLGSEVDWETETGCFQTLSREIANLYAAEPPLIQTNEQDQHNVEDLQEETSSSTNVSAHKQTPYMWTVEHILFPAIKTHLIAPKSLIVGEEIEKGRAHVIQLASLPDLYKIFERC